MKNYVPLLLLILSGLMIFAVVAIHLWLGNSGRRRVGAKIQQFSGWSALAAAALWAASAAIPSFGFSADDAYMAMAFAALFSAPSIFAFMLGGQGPGEKSA